MSTEPELLIKETTVYNNWSAVYACDFSTRTATVDVLQWIRNTYGDIEDIICFFFSKEGEENRSSSHVEYDTMEEFLSGFGEKEFSDFGVIKCICTEKYISFCLDKDNKIVRVHSSEGYLGKRVYDPAKVGYYRDDCGTIVKYDANKAMIYEYDLEKHKWVKSRWRRYEFFDREERHYEKVELSDDELKVFMNGNDKTN